MSGIIRSVIDELERHDVESVEAVDLVIGEMTFLGEEQLLFAWEIMTRDTQLEDAKLNITHEAVEVSCGSCGYKGGIEYLGDENYGHVIPILSCPKCGGDIEVIRGKSCTVNSLQVVQR